MNDSEHLLLFGFVVAAVMLLVFSVQHLAFG